jgi:hypothetical protein
MGVREECPQLSTSEGSPAPKKGARGSYPQGLSIETCVRFACRSRISRQATVVGAEVSPTIFETLRSASLRDFFRGISEDRGDLIACLKRSRQRQGHQCDRVPSIRRRSWYQSPPGRAVFCRGAYRGATRRCLLKPPAFRPVALSPLATLRCQETSFRWRRNGFPRRLRRGSWLRERRSLRCSTSLPERPGFQQVEYAGVRRSRE